MGYRLEICDRRLILRRNGKQTELYIRKFDDTKIYEWVKKQVLHAPKGQIDMMLHSVGIFIKRKVNSYGRKRISKATSEAKKIPEISAVGSGARGTSENIRKRTILGC